MVSSRCTNQPGDFALAARCTRADLPDPILLATDYQHWTIDARAIGVSSRAYRASEGREIPYPKLCRMLQLASRDVPAEAELGREKGRST